MATRFEDYANKFETIRFRREDGILEMTLHTNGGSLRWGPAAHSNLEEAFNDVGRDPEHQIIILTGAGAEFSGPEVPSSTDRAVPKLTPKVAEESYRVWLNGFTSDGKIPLKDLQEIYDEAFAAKLIPSAVPVPKVMDYTWVDEVMKEKK